MDISPFDTSDTMVPLPYDDYQPAAEESSTSADSRSLADRISSTKIYLLSDASKSRSGKRRRDAEEDASEEVEMDQGDSLYRDNAILLQGSPISHLPTSNIFAYATHFDTHPLGLEWIDDKTCILVYESAADARNAFRLFQKSLVEEQSPEDGTITAKPIPIAIWPNKERIDATLGQGEGLKGILRMRWARVEDIKKKRARDESQFYRKYGRNAGKTFEEGPPAMKRQRPEGPGSESVEKAKLDEELDSFLAEDDDSPPSPPSKMRSDYIDKDGRTLLERTSLIRVHPNPPSQRITAPLPRRAGPRGDNKHHDEGKRPGLHERFAESNSTDGTGHRERRRERRPPRPKVTQEDLDAELDAFLNSN